MVSKTTVDFLRDLSEVQDLLIKFNKEVGDIYSAVDNKNTKNEEILKSFINRLNLEDNSEIRMALATRLVSLRDDSMVQVLKKEGRKESEIDQIKDIAFDFVSNFYLKRHKNLISEIEKNGLLTPFYRKVFSCFAKVGKAFTDWQLDWTNSIVRGVNKKLLVQFENNEEKVCNYLSENQLIDLGHGEQAGDRCYSVLFEKEKEKGKWISKSYLEYFPTHVNNVIFGLKEMMVELAKEEDRVFNDATYPYQENDIIEKELGWKVSKNLDGFLPETVEFYKDNIDFYKSFLI